MCVVQCMYVYGCLPVCTGDMWMYVCVWMSARLCLSVQVTCGCMDVCVCVCLSVQVTYADFAVYMLMEHGVKIGLPVADDYPTLAKLKESVENIPSIAKWLKERPVTEL